MSRAKDCESQWVPVLFILYLENSRAKRWTTHQNPHHSNFMYFSCFTCLFIYLFMGAKKCNMPNWTALIFFPAIFPCRSYCSHSLNNILHSLDLLFFFCGPYSFLLFPVLIFSIWYGTCSYPVSVSIKESCPLNSHLIYQSASSQTPLLDPNLFNATVTDRRPDPGNPFRSLAHRAL